MREHNSGKKDLYRNREERESEIIKRKEGEPLMTHGFAKTGIKTK